MEHADCVVIGAGVIGLAVARALALKGREVLVLEREGNVGSGISSRNSEVIHAGMYYPEGSLKARLCVTGNRRLREYAASHGVPFRMTGKLIVATTEAEETTLDELLARGHANGVRGLRKISAGEAKAMEPSLRVRAALHSPETGVIDSHQYLLALQGEAEANGAIFIAKTPVIGGSIDTQGALLDLGDREGTKLRSRDLVIASGLSSSQTARTIGLPGVPDTYMCKGNYFSVQGRQPFGRLVYPVPAEAGLGIHYTLDLAGRGRFGPDTEWIGQEDYRVDPMRASAFVAAIRRYWPDLPDDALAPDYAGIRPKLQRPGGPAKDFAVAGPSEHGVPGVVALYGIESPGLTASLSLAELVCSTLIPS